ncbi:DUF6615 family protein [Phytobacter ursingii]
MSVFSDISEYVWNLLHDGKKLGISIGEETISDLILLEIARRDYNYVTIMKTTKDKESVKGTDWEWWIGSRQTGWIRYAIQAKKMDYNQYSYKKLKHEVGKNKILQHNILYQYAKNTKAVPLYAFYNYPRHAKLDEYWNCKKPISKKKMGITVANLEVVVSAIHKKRGKNFESIHKVKTTYPLCCLLECIGTRSKYIYKNQTSQQPPDVMTLSDSNFIMPEHVIIGQHQMHENDVNLDYVFKGYDISSLFKNGEAFNTKRECFYPNKTPIPTRVLVIDLELLKNTKQ